VRTATRGLILFALVLLAWPATAAKVTVDDLMGLRSLSQVRISPDGKRVAYVISTPSFEKADHEAVLYVVPSSGDTPVRLTEGTRIFNKPLPAPALRWSPDGSLLSFIGFVNDTPQVMAISPDGGEAYPLTSVEGGITTYEWSPDGKRIAYQAPDPIPAEELQRKKDKTYVIEVDRNKRPPRLWVVDVPDGTPKALSPLDQWVVDFSWAPDGKEILYSSARKFGFYAPYNTTIYAVPASGGDSRALVSRPGTNRSAQSSPDGKWIAFISSGGTEGMVTAKDLYVVAAGGDPATMRKLSDEAWMGEFIWAPDSRSILYTTWEQTHGARERMFEQPVMRVDLEGGRSKSVTPEGVVTYSLGISNDSTLLAYKGVKSRDVGDVYVTNLTEGRTSRLTEINPQLSQWELGELKPVSWKSFDGAEIWGLLLTPPGYAAGKRIPLVVYCHGGPIGGFTYGIFPQFSHIVGQVTPYPSEAMASAGMAILFPMPRGGSGYGIAGFFAIMKSWGETDYKDIMAGVDAMVERGIADPERLGVMGASYGGFMTNWIVTQTGRFKAASTGASLSNLAEMYYLSDGGEFMAEYYGVPWEEGASLAAHSPITYVTQVTTPLLIQHGENDMRVPVQQAWEFYRALKGLGKVVEFDIYPRGGHVDFEPPLEREYMRRNLEWFTRWLKPGSPE
jgi:dipeptidyl aminopeptidase/acylaminoacyl peptidase